MPYRIKNWRKFQHYKDRNPPWIKLHFELLSSPDWVTLDDASRVLAIACMLIGSRNDGEVPDDPSYLKRVAYLNKTPNYKPLIQCGFLESASACKQVLAEFRPETETETYEEETETETDSAASRLNGLQASFTRFWSEYPKKIGKGAAEKAWMKIHPDEPLSETIVSSLRKQSNQQQWLKDDGQFIPNPATWLNQKRWEDEPVKDAVARFAESVDD